MKLSLENYIASKIQSRKTFIKDEPTSRQEIHDLFRVARRDLEESKKSEISEDWQFGIAYNAALKLCTILLRADCKRISSGGAHHFLTIMTLPFYLGEDYETMTNYLNRCRKKRNRIEYESVGGVNSDEISELIALVRDLMQVVEKWVYTNHPELM
jgi:hypothetical protein